MIFRLWLLLWFEARMILFGQKSPKIVCTTRESGKEISLMGSARCWTKRNKKSSFVVSSKATPSQINVSKSVKMVPYIRDSLIRIGRWMGKEFSKRRSTTMKGIFWMANSMEKEGMKWEKLFLKEFSNKIKNFKEGSKMRNTSMLALLLIIRRKVGEC